MERWFLEFVHRALKHGNERKGPKLTKPLILPQSGWVREPTVLAVVPWGRTKLRQEIAAGRFPAPHRFSERVIAWDSRAVHSWIDQQRQPAQDGQVCA